MAALRPALLMVDPIPSGGRLAAAIRQFVRNSTVFDFDCVAERDSCENSAVLVLNVDVV
jgi:hypothetical protein